MGVQVGGVGQGRSPEPLNPMQVRHSPAETVPQQRPGMDGTLLAQLPAGATSVQAQGAPAQATVPEDRAAKADELYKKMIEPMLRSMALVLNPSEVEAIRGVFTDNYFRNILPALATELSIKDFFARLGDPAKRNSEEVRLNTAFPLASAAYKKYEDIMAVNPDYIGRTGEQVSVYSFSYSSLQSLFGYVFNNIMVDRKRGELLDGFYGAARTAVRADFSSMLASGDSFLAFVNGLNAQDKLQVKTILVGLYRSYYAAENLTKEKIEKINNYAEFFELDQATGVYRFKEFSEEKLKAAGLYDLWAGLNKKTEDEMLRSVAVSLKTRILAVLSGNSDIKPYLTDGGKDVSEIIAHGDPQKLFELLGKISDNSGSLVPANKLNQIESGLLAALAMQSYIKCLQSRKVQSQLFLMEMEVYRSPKFVELLKAQIANDKSDKLKDMITTVLRNRIAEFVDIDISGYDLDKLITFIADFKPEGLSSAKTGELATGFIHYQVVGSAGVENVSKQDDPIESAKGALDTGLDPKEYELLTKRLKELGSRLTVTEEAYRTKTRAEIEAYLTAVDKHAALLAFLRQADVAGAEVVLYTRGANGAAVSTEQVIDLGAAYERFQRYSKGAGFQVQTQNGSISELTLHQYARALFEDFFASAEARLPTRQVDEKRNPINVARAAFAVKQLRMMFEGTISRSFLRASLEEVSEENFGKLLSALFSNPSEEELKLKVTQQDFEGMLNNLVADGVIKPEIKNNLAAIIKESLSPKTQFASMLSGSQVFNADLFAYYRARYSDDKEMTIMQLCEKLYDVLSCLKNITLTAEDLLGGDSRVLESIKIKIKALGLTDEAIPIALKLVQLALSDESIGIDPAYVKAQQDYTSWVVQQKPYQDSLGATLNSRLEIGDKIVEVGEDLYNILMVLARSQELILADQYRRNIDANKGQQAVTSMGGAGTTAGTRRR
ncbi:MAG: hypothetical protein WC490_07975 [Candidatus Margulisiibacteriota bacterium]